MHAEKIIDTKNFTLIYYPEEKIIHHTFHDYVYGNILRSYLHEGVRIMKEHSATKWLSDDRDNPTLSPADVDYGKDIWVSKAIEAGWKYWALILPGAVIGKSSMSGLLDFVSDKGVVVEFFNDTDEAFAWLNKQ